MDNTLVKEKVQIKNLIYEIRGKQVMLDSDLASIYQCKNGTKEINQAVRNNIKKFPERFCFRLTNEETNNLKSKILTSSEKKHGGRRYNPRVFTEQGVAMLATVLKSKVSYQVSIAIMDAFVAMRHYIATNLIEQKYINELVLKDSKRIDLLEETFSKFDGKTNHLFFYNKLSL